MLMVNEYLLNEKPRCVILLNEHDFLDGFTILNRSFFRYRINMTAEDKGMEITSGIHRIDGVRGANCYFVITESKMLVIDTGMPGNGNKIIKYVNRLGRNPSDINYVILTHADIDHIGSAAELKKITGAKLAIHANDAPILWARVDLSPSKGLLEYFSG